MEDFCKLHTIFKVRANPLDLFELCLINCLGNQYLYARMNGPIPSADFGYLRVTIFGTKFQTSVPVY